MMFSRGFWLAVFAGVSLSACVKAPSVATLPASERAGIEARLMRDISVLASDEFGGRQPGSEGERLTVRFLIDEMQKAGLSSGTNDPGSAWRAPVRLVANQPVESGVSFTIDGRKTRLEDSEGAAFTSGSQLLISDGELVYVGKQAQGVPTEAIAGKIVVMIGEPGRSPARRRQLFASDPAAIITIVEDGEALERVHRAYGRERTSLAREEEHRLTAFVTRSAMADLLGEMRWGELLDQAQDDEGEIREFAPISLGATGTLHAVSRRREYTSSNVIGKLPGRQPGSGAVLLLAHWDHLGTRAEDSPSQCRVRDDDAICNGAIDNASGVALMLELSRRLAAGGPYDRDIYVLATTAEEMGLYGAYAFVESPPTPLDNFVAAFNFDTVAIAPSGSPVGFVGEGRTPLDQMILQVMDEAGRELGNREFGESFLRRQDGWALLDNGVPAVFLSTAFGSEIVLGPYLSNNYHRASDEIDQIELGGAIDDLLLHQELIRRIANIATYSPPLEGER